MREQRPKPPQRRSAIRSTVTMLVSVACLLVWLDACASAGSVRLEATAPVGPTPVWPAEPDPARVRFLRSFTSARDLGFKRSFLSRVADLIRGRDDNSTLRHPYGVAVTADERVYVVDAASKGVHSFDLPEGKYRFLTGNGFSSPIGVTTDSLGRVFVSDSEDGVVVVLDEDGDELNRLRDPLLRPTGVAFHRQTDLLYVVDTGAHRIVVFDMVDGSVATTFGERGSGPGQFNYPTQIAVDLSGRIYVSDSMNFRVQVLEPDGTPVRTFGRLGDAVGDFARPKGIGVDAAGRVFVVEGLFDVVNLFDERGRTLMSFGGPGQGPGEFWLATGLAVDGKGRIFVADSYNGRVQVFQMLPEPAP